YPLSLHDALPISIDPDGLLALFAVIDIVASEVSVGAGRPGQIYKWLLADSRKDGLQTRGHRGRKDVLSKNMNRWRIVAFHLEWGLARIRGGRRSEEHTSELQSRGHLVCRLLLEKKNKKKHRTTHTEAHARVRDRQV